VKIAQIGDATLYTADVLEALQSMPDESVHCVVTSPPYWGLRDYGVPGQVGFERTPEEYVAKMVEVFREIRRALRLGRRAIGIDLKPEYIAMTQERIAAEATQRKLALGDG